MTALETWVETGVDECLHRTLHAVMNISYATDLWLGELERRGHKRSTVDRYRRLLDSFAAQHPRHLDVRDVTTIDVRQFLDWNALRRDGKGRKGPSTIAADVSTINGFFDWLTREGVIKQNPTRRYGDRILARPIKPDPVENDNVVTVSSEDVRRLLIAAETWQERLVLNILVYTGARRHAVAQARLRDYDQVARTLTFEEKGGKTIAKPVAHKLGELLDAAICAGQYSGPDDYLIPMRAEQRRAGDRDDRIVYNLVKKVAYRAGVKTHVHALRAAFAVFFLEQNPGESVGLQKLMGHKRPETTAVYLRRLDRRLMMESVRSLDWNLEVPAISGESFQALNVTEKEGFEPSKPVLPLLERDSTRPEPLH